MDYVSAPSEAQVKMSAEARDTARSLSLFNPIKRYREVFLAQSNGFTIPSDEPIAGGAHIVADADFYLAAE
jgi:hypothetical protein